MKRMRLLFVLLALATVGVATAAAAKSPQAEIAAIKGAVAGRHSVEYVSEVTAPGYYTHTISDVGDGVGAQRTLIRAAGRSGMARVRVTAKGAYIEGDEFALRVYFGFSPLQSAGYAGRWIFIPHKNPAFKTLASDATFASFSADVLPAGKLSLVKTGHLVGVRGITSGHSSQTKTVFAPAHGTALPVKTVRKASGAADMDTWRMSRWNETVHVAAPAKSVPIKQVTGG